MKLNKTHKRNKNNKKLNLKCGKTKKGKTKKGNKTIGGALPKVKVISKFIKKNDDQNGDVNRFDINISSHYNTRDLLYQADDFLNRFELDLLNYTDKTKYEEVNKKKKGNTKESKYEFTIEAIKD